MNDPGLSLFLEFSGLFYCLVLLAPLVFLQRRLHWELQASLLLLIRRADIAVAVFSLLFFPGVVLHEGSHWLTARLLAVRTNRFSLLPAPMPDGRLQLGFVETARTDFVRDSLIGAAPLLVGGAFVAYVGVMRLGLVAVWGALLQADFAALQVAFSRLPAQPDFWLWFYLAFTVSSTMLPSPSDRQGWRSFGVAVGLAAAAALLAGAGPWMLANLAPTLNRALQALAAALGVSVVLHLALLLPVWLLRCTLTHLMGVSVG